MRTNAAEEGGSIAYAEDHGGMATMAYASMSNMQPQRVEQPITRQQNNQPAGAPVVTYDDPNAGRFTPGQVRATPFPPCPCFHFFVCSISGSNHLFRELLISNQDHPLLLSKLLKMLLEWLQLFVMRQ